MLEMSDRYLTPLEMVMLKSDSDFQRGAARRAPEWLV